MGVVCGACPCDVVVAREGGVLCVFETSVLFVGDYARMDGSDIFFAPCCGLYGLISAAIMTGMMWRHPVSAGPCAEAFGCGIRVYDL